jgi:hypothetical protein
MTITTDLSKEVNTMNQSITELLKEINKLNNLLSNELLQEDINIYKIQRLSQTIYDITILIQSLKEDNKQCATQ